MQKSFKLMGWGLIGGSVVCSLLVFSVLNRQEFVVALLARVVERPFEYRTYFSALTAATVLVTGCLAGAIYVGIAEILRAFARLSPRGGS